MLRSIQVVAMDDLDAEDGPPQQKWGRAFAVDDARVIVSRMAAGAVSAWHQHKDWDVYAYVYSGAGRLEYHGDGTAQAFARGDFIYIPPGTVHREANTGSSEQVIIAVMHGSGDLYAPADGPAPVRGEAPAVARPSDLVATYKTKNLIRETPYPDRDVLVFRAKAAGGAKAGWHHHGANIYFAVFTGGEAGRMEYGPGGERAVDVVPGEIFNVPTGFVHRDVNPTDHWHEAVVWLVGGEPRVVNVDAPETPQGDA